MLSMLKWLFYIIIIFCTISSLLWLTSNFDNETFVNFDNKNGLDYPIIPNIIHYVIFKKNSLDFPNYLSILSSIKFQKPTVLYIHSDCSNFTGNYWNKVQKINTSHPIITLHYMSQPTHVYGQKLSSVFHASDVARIHILQQWGGIYLDTDTVLLKNLDEFRHFEMVVAWPRNQYMGTQILLAHKNARFLSAWLEGYRRYKPTNWYYNAGQYPTEQLLEKKPLLAHRVPELFGVHNLENELYERSDWSDWRRYYALHLLSRHSKASKFVNETLIINATNSFGDIVKHIFYT